MLLVWWCGVFERSGVLICRSTINGGDENWLLAHSRFDRVGVVTLSMPLMAGHVVPPHCPCCPDPDAVTIAAEANMSDYSDNGQCEGREPARLYVGFLHGLHYTKPYSSMTVVYPNGGLVSRNVPLDVHDFSFFLEVVRKFVLYSNRPQNGFALPLPSLVNSTYVILI